MDFPIGVSPISCLNFPSHKTRRSRKESPISGPSVSAVHGHTIRKFFSGIGRDTSAYPRPTAVCGVCLFTLHVLWIGVKDGVVFTEFRKLFWRSFGSDHYHGPIRTGIAIVFPTSIWIRHGEMHMAKKIGDLRGSFYGFLVFETPAAAGSSSEWSNLLFLGCMRYR